MDPKRAPEAHKYLGGARLASVKQGSPADALDTDSSADFGYNYDNLEVDMADDFEDDASSGNHDYSLNNEDDFQLSVSMKTKETPGKATQASATERLK